MNLLGLGGNALYLVTAAGTDIADNIPGEYLDIVVILGLIFIGLILIMGILTIIRLLISGTKSMYNSGGKNASDTADSTLAGKTNEYSLTGFPGQQNLSTDPKLVAVITAAILASMEDAPADGLVIRSIRRK